MKEKAHMFKFIRSILKKEPKLAKEEVGLGNLQAWISVKKQQSESAAQKEIEQKAEELKQALEGLKNAVSALENATLQNPNIPEKAKHFMAGNRQFFIKAASQFKERIIIPKDISEVSKFSADAEASLREFIDKIQRPFQILQEFFSNESKEVMQKVYSVEKVRKEMNEVLQKHNVEAISEIESAIENMNDAEEGKGKLERVMSKQQDLLKEANEMLKKAENSIVELEDSREYKSLQNLKKDLEQVISDIRRIRAGITQKFHAIEPALKKYERITLHNQEMVKDYILNPVETLARDRDFAILLIVQAMRKEVKEDRIDLKDKKKEKVISAMDEFTPEVLNAFLKSYGSLTLEQSELMREIGSMDVVSRVASARKKEEQLKNERNAIEHEIAEIRAKIETSDSEVFINKIVELARQKLKIDLKITTK